MQLREYQELVEFLTRQAKKLYNVNTVFHSDIYQLNNEPDVKYGVICIEPDEITETEDFWQYRFRLTYVDILKAEGPIQSNLLEIQSNGLECLSVLLRGLPEDYEILSKSYRTFNMRFNDDCAGAYCWCTIQVPKGVTCYYENTPGIPK